MNQMHHHRAAIGVALLMIGAVGCIIRTGDGAELDEVADDGDGDVDPDIGPDDRDGDGLTNAEEQLTNTSPDAEDSDGDGVNDGEEDHDGDGATNRAELALGTDPADSADNPEARAAIEAARVDWTLTGPIVRLHEGPDVTGVLTVQLVDACTADADVLDEQAWPAATVRYYETIDAAVIDEAPRYFFEVADGTYFLRATLDAGGDGADLVSQNGPFEGEECRRYTLDGRGFVELPLPLCEPCAP